MNTQNYYNPSNANDNTTNQKRRFPRRANDVCMVNVDGHPYPVSDWSQCGVLFEADTKRFESGQHVNLIIRFKVGNEIQDIKVSGEVIRKNNQTVAIQFTDYKSVQSDFDGVIDQLSFG